MRYTSDTVEFSTGSRIGGLIYLPSVNKKNPQITLTVKNREGIEKSADFLVSSIKPYRLKWHKLIKRWYKNILDNPDWYYFEITPVPSVINAKAGVEFLSLIKDGAVNSSKLNTTAIFSYKLKEGTTFNTCSLDFRNNQGFFQGLWEKLSYYQKVIADKNKTEAEQAEVVKKCSKYGFEQVSQWAVQSEKLKEDLVNSDLKIFREVENLKIITESLPDSVSKDLKRLLRSLLMLDIAILENNGFDNEQKNKQKKDLIKQLSLYPELGGILGTYILQTTNSTSAKQMESQQTSLFEDITDLYGPFESYYKSYQNLQTKLDALNQQLLHFD